MSHRIDSPELLAVHRNTTPNIRVHLYQGEVVFVSRPSLGPIQPRIQWVMGALISGESGKTLKLCIWRAAVEVCPYLHYLRHSPLCSYLHPSDLLRIICWFVTDVSGQRVGPVSKGQDVQAPLWPELPSSDSCWKSKHWDGEICTSNKRWMLLVPTGGLTQ